MVRFYARCGPGRFEDHASYLCYIVYSLILYVMRVAASNKTNVHKFIKYISLLLDSNFCIRGHLSEIQ